jgi:hypothetical protein
MRNVLIPKSSGKGIIILPHNIWDWYSSLTVDHHFNTHILNIFDHAFKDHREKAERYWLDLIRQNAEASESFSYATIQCE